MNDLESRPNSLLDFLEYQNLLKSPALTSAKKPSSILKKNSAHTSEEEGSPLESKSKDSKKRKTAEDFF